MQLYKLYERNMPEIDPVILLAHKCLDARRRAEEARAEQLQLEGELLACATVKLYLKESGSTSFMGGFFKVQNKVNQRWDQARLADILVSNEWPVMPFEIEYKPVAGKLKIIRDYHPELYTKLMPALTETPAKPYFSFDQGDK